MEKSNYTDTLDKLKADRLRLNKELEIIDVAINALTALSSGIEAVVFVDKDKIKYTNTTNTKKIRRNYYEDVDVVIDDKYNPDSTPIEQVIYALLKIKSGTIEDIAGHIVEIDNTKDYEKIFPRFRDIASGLYRAGKIDADTRRKKYRYSLKASDLEKYEDDKLFV